VLFHPPGEPGHQRLLTPSAKERSG